MTMPILASFLEEQGRDLYLKSLSVWLSPTMKLARTFNDIEDIPKDILRQSEEIYDLEFKDSVERKVRQRMQFEREVRKMYPDKNVLRPRVPASIQINQPSVQQDISRLSQQIGIHTWKILNPTDARTCSKCREWIGREVSDADGTLDEWHRSGALHIGCRCSLHPTKDIRDVQERAQDYMSRKGERIRELVRFKIAYHTDPMIGDIFIL